MASDKPLFDGATTRLNLKVEAGPDHSAIVRMLPATPADQVPEWDERSSDQANALLALLKFSFGKVTRVTGQHLAEEAIRINVPAGNAPETHAGMVAEKVKLFSEEHQIELDTGDAQHFREIVDIASQKDLRRGIKRIVEDQLLDSDQKTDGILDLVQRKRSGGVGGPGGGVSNN